MHRRLILALAPAALALSCAVAVHAQPAGQPAGPPPLGPHHPPAAERKARHEAMRKQRLEDLRIVLRVRPDQEAALAAFAAAHQPRTFERKLPRGLTTPQRLEAMGKHEAEMAAHHEAMRQALAKFYAALSPDQQKVFDALHRLQGAHGGRRMASMHGGPTGDGPRIFMPRHGGGPSPDDDAPPR
jgi:periplasmic protein CpxP/Spy